MNLPDFDTALPFIRLREAMGVETIAPLPPLTFQRRVRRERPIQESPGRRRKMEATLRTRAIPASGDQIEVSPEGLLEYRGRRVSAYIRDQRFGFDPRTGGSNYRYHLTHCSTLQQMRDYGREGRYLVSRRTDGKFLVQDLSGSRPRERTFPLRLCQNCQGKLRSLGIYRRPFSLKTFFRDHDTRIPDSIRKTEFYEEIQTYQPDQAELSARYRKSVKYCCQRCQVRAGAAQKELLHLHHRDGNPANNDATNLAVLCVYCHAHQPMHGHMTNNPQMQRSIQRVEELQQEQGILR